MANNYIDPTKKGTQGLKGINQLGYDPTTSGLPLSNEEAALLGNLNKKFSDYDDSSLYYNPQVQPDSNWGDSVYDDNIYIGNLDQDVIQNRRADLQSAGVQLLNGVLKGVSTAATTIIDGVVGLPLGIIEAIGQGDVSKIWDNEITYATKGVSDAMEQIAPNYRSVEEEEAPFWKNLDTPNFWGDTIIKNFGFLIGAYYGGLPYAKLGQLLTVGGVKTAQFFNASAKAIQNTAKVGNYATKGIHAGTSAVIEGSIEAKNNSQDWYNLQKAKTDDYYAQALDELDSTYLKGTPEYDNAYQQIAQAYNYSLQELDQKKKEMGNMDLALNIPILTMSNIIQFAKILGGGFTTGVKGGLNIKGTLGNFRTSVGKHSYLKSGIKNALTEGTEEMAQKIASDFSGNLRGAEYTNYAIDEFRNAKVDVKASKESEGAVTSLGNAIYDNVTSAKSWEEFFVGALFGLVGMPQFGVKDNGKFGFKGMGGGIWNDYKENAEKLKEEQELVDYLNTRGAKELKETWQGLVRNKYYEDQKQEAIANRDEKAYHDANQKQAISDVIMFGKAGKLELLEAQLDNLDKSTDDTEFIAELIEKTKQTKTVDQQKAEIDTQIQGIREDDLQGQFALFNLQNRRDSLQKKVQAKKDAINKETNDEKKNTLEREAENLEQQLNNLNEELNKANTSIKEHRQERVSKIQELEDSKKDFQEYTFGPFMQGDTSMSQEEARKKVKSKIKETRALLNTYKNTSEEIQQAFQGKLSREQEETLIFLKLQQGGNKKRLVDLINSLRDAKVAVIDQVTEAVNNAEKKLNEAKSEGKSEEEIKKLEENYKNAQYTLDAFNSVFNEELDPEKLDTKELENIGFANILNKVLDSYEANKDATIFGKPTQEVLESLKQKGKDIDALIKETNLYDKKFIEYKINPKGINQDRDKAEKEKANNKTQQELDELKETLHLGTRRERAEAVEEYEGNPNEAPETGELTPEETKHLQQAKFDNATIKKLINKAINTLLGNNPSIKSQEILEDIIKSIVCAELAINRDEIEQIVETKGNQLIQEFLDNPSSFKEGETAGGLAQKMLEFFGNLDLNKEQKELRALFARDAKAEAERIKQEQKEEKELTNNTHNTPEQDSEEPMRKPKDGPESDAALEPSQSMATSATDVTTSSTEPTPNTASSNSASAKEINFEANSRNSQTLVGRKIKGLKPMFSLFYQGKGPSIKFLEALRLDFLKSVNDSSRQLQLFFKVSQEYLDKYKSKHETFIDIEEALEQARKDPDNYENYLRKTAFFKHMDFLQEIYSKLGMSDTVKQLQNKDKLIIRAYEDSSYGVIPIIYRVYEKEGKKFEIPVGIAMTEFYLNCFSKFKNSSNQLLKDYYKEVAEIVEFLKNNKKGYLETSVSDVFGGMLSLSDEEVTVSSLYENKSTPKLGVITSTTDAKSMEGNVAAENTLRVNNAKQGQVYVLVESPFGTYIPALAVPRTLSSILKDKESWEAQELINRITEILTSSISSDELKERLKDCIYLPGLKIEYDANSKKYKFIYSTKLSFQAGEKSSKKVELSTEGINKEKVRSFLEELLKDTEYKDTLTINVNKNKIDFNNKEHLDYINFISRFITVNLNSTTAINNWFSFDTPKGIVSTPTPAVSTPTDTNTTSNVTIDLQGSSVNPDTGTTTDANDQPINDDKIAEEQQRVASQNSNAVAVQSALSQKLNLGGTLTSSQSQPQTSDNDAETDDDVEEDDPMDTMEEYHAGIFRRVPKDNMLSKYFERQKSKIADIKPQSSSQIPKNLNNIETENFNSCQ